MNTQLIKTAIFSLALSFFLASCETLSSLEIEEELTNTELIVGKWNVTSYTFDGKEEIGGHLHSMTMDFDPLVGVRGSSTRIFTAASGAQSADLSPYGMNELTEEIIFFSSGMEFRYDLTFQGNNRLIMSAATSTGFQIIRAERPN
jgi:hypothetical protein